MPAGTAGDWTNPRPREGTGETLQDLHRLEYKAAVEKKKKGHNLEDQENSQVGQCGEGWIQGSEQSA